LSSLAILTRAQAARIRDLLRDKRVRNAEGAFIIEGAKPVFDVLLHQPASVKSLIVSEGYERRETDQHRRLRASRNISSCRCSDRTFATFSKLDTPQGILAIVRQPQWPEKRILGQPSLFAVFGEDLQDPANVGAIIRTAAALNVDALWLTPESADIYHPKVVRASAGAVLSLPVFVTENIARLTGHEVMVFAAQVAADHTVDLESVRTIPRRLVVALGNESRGLSADTLKEAACRFTIPLTRHIESLNVAATAAIALHYLRGLKAGA
jgi:TrmH family RNA methyltransferase